MRLVGNIMQRRFMNNNNYWVFIYSLWKKWLIFIIAMLKLMVQL